MSRTTVFRASLWLALPIVAVAGQLAMAANHAPVLDASKSPVLAPECQNAGAPSGAVGTLVATLVDFAVPSGQVDNVTDSDAGAKLGIAVTAANTTSGSWWYSKNNGTNWYGLGAVTNKSARLLAADASTRIYFTPNANYYGTLATAITFRAWDQTSGSNGNLASTSKNGGSTAFSTATDTASLLVVWVPPLDPPPPVEFHVTFTGELEVGGTTNITAINSFGTAVGTALLPSQGRIDPLGFVYQHAIRWTPQHGLEDISSLAAPWFDLETNTVVDGWIFFSAADINGLGQIAGRAWDGNFLRACVYDESIGFRLLPRWEQPPYYEATCWYGVRSINESGDVCVQMNPTAGYPWKTYLWTPANPGTINVLEPAAQTDQYPTGIGSNVFSVWTEGTPWHRDLYGFQVHSDGALSYELLDTFADSSSLTDDTYINNSGAFGYASDNGTTQSVRLYRPGQGSLTVHESPHGTYASVRTCQRINNSNDFLYELDGIPYLYRGSENRSYRLYDLADNYTKSALFASSGGNMKSGYGFVIGVVSDDNVACTPVDDPFDTLGGIGTVLTPVPKQ